MEEQCTDDSFSLSWNCVQYLLHPQLGLVVIPVSRSYSIYDIVGFALPLVSNCLCEVCHHILMINCRFGISVPLTFFGAFFVFRKDVSAH